MRGCEFIRTDGSQGAIKLYGEHRIGQSIQLSEVPRWGLHLYVGIVIRRGSLLIGGRRRGVAIIVCTLHLEYDLIALTSEQGLYGVHSSTVLGVQKRQLLKFKLVVARYII
jgi:hypothetical protein